MESIKDPYLQRRIPQQVEEISEILSKKGNSLLVLVDGLPGSGKDFVINRTIECFQNSAVTVCKSASKKSTRKARVDELEGEKSISGTRIVTEDSLRETPNLFEYTFINNKYAVDLEILKNELDSNSIVFLPIAELSCMKGANALNNYINIQNKIRELLPNIKVFHVTIDRPLHESLEAVENRVESSAEEVKSRIRILTTSNDSPYKQELINKGYIKKIRNYVDPDIDQYNGAYEVLWEIRDRLEKSS